MSGKILELESARVMKEAERRGERKGAVAFVRTTRRLHISEDDILEGLMEGFHMDEEDAMKLMRSVL